MSDNEHLIRHLIASGVLRTLNIIHAFRQCDRILFVPEEYYSYTYEDRPLPIGRGQTISQPYTVAIMLELLAPQDGNRVLDIGSGSGWTTALLSSAVGSSGVVEGIEIVPALVEYGNQNLSKADIVNGSIELGDSSTLGKPGKLFDRILVSASASEMPVQLFDQLKPGGILVMPIQNSIWRFVKEEDGSIASYELPGFVFVPLIVD